MSFFALDVVSSPKNLVGYLVALRPVVIIVKSLITKLGQKIKISVEDVTRCLKYCLKLEPVTLQPLESLIVICKQKNVSVILFV